MIVPGIGSIRDARRCPTVSTRIVSATGIEVNKGTAVLSAPDNHFSPSPDRSVKASRLGRIDGASCCPTVRARTISAAGIEIIAAIGSAPDYHLTASPDRCVTLSGSGRVGNAGGCPRVIGASVPSVR